MGADNTTNRSTRQGTRWDFTAVDAAPDPQSFVRYLEQRQSGEVLDLRRQLSYDLLEVQEGQHLLDVGCGIAGTTSVRWHAWSVLRGVSSDSTTVSDSWKQPVAGQHMLSIPGTFVQADMHHMPFANASFDGCRAERILVHSAQPSHVVEEMRRVVRPGGHIVVTEPDLDTLVFHSSSLAVVRKLTQWHSDGVRNGTIGRWLPEMFRRCGLQDVRVVPTVAQNSQPSSYSRTLAMRALEAGVLTPEEAQEVVADWQRRAEQQDYLEFGVFFTVSGHTST